MKTTPNKPPPVSALGALILAAARRAKVPPTLYAIAQETGVAKNTIRDVVQGRGSPSVSTLEKIAEGLGCEVYIQIKPTSRRK